MVAIQKFAVVPERNTDMKNTILSLCSVALLGFSVAAHADSIGTTKTFTLTEGGSVAATPGNYGTIVLTQTATGLVTVTETLHQPGEYYASTGAGDSLAFNISLADGALTFGSI